MNYEKIKSVVLTLLVLVSLAFTWGIWNYQPSYQTIEDGANENIVNEVKIGQQRQISDLLKPTRIISHQKGQHYGTVSEQELDWVMKEMGKWIFSEPENISSSLNEQEFSGLLSGGDKHVELFFSSSVPFDTLNKLISFTESPVPNAVFNRIVITEAEQENKAFVYFVSVKEQLVFKSEIQARSLKEFKQRYVASQERLEPYLSYQIPNGSLLYVREAPPVLPIQGYLRMKQIDADMFKRALFNDPSYVKRGSSSRGEEYTDGVGLMLVNSNTGQIKYVNLAETTQAIPLNQLIEQSVEFVNEHSGWVDSYRLFQAEPNSPTISYRMFYGDFPVFNQQKTAEISQIWGQERIYQYERSTFILSEPLPPDFENTVMLKSGQEVLDQVMQLESIDPKLLTDIRIGYEMTLEQEDFLFLKPAWYYQHDGDWLKLVTEEEEQADGLE